MSLITQCPACATLFKVVPDQLRVSDGWVRCGQCDEVFDANAHLRTTQQEARQSMFGDSQFPPDFVHSRIASEPQPSADKKNVPARAQVAPRQSAQGPEYSSAPSQPGDARSVASGAQFNSAVDAADGAADLHAENASETEAAVRAEYDALLRTVEVEAEPESEPMPSVEQEQEWASSVASVEQAAQPTPRDEWADAIGEPVLSFMQSDPVPDAPVRPWVRPTLLTVWMVLLLALVLQVVVHERDRLAAKAPALAPWVAGLCDLVGCQLAALREIESVVIDSSSFVKVRTDVYRLHLTLKNTAIYAVATPALELTLTNVHDQPIARRVFLPSEFGVSQEAMEPGAELLAKVAVSAKLSTDSEPISGYRLLVFYP